MRFMITLLAISLLVGCGSARPPTGRDNPQCNLSRFYVNDALSNANVYARPLDKVVDKVELNILELSAGGEYGAYGAGFLVGWGSVGDVAKPVARNKIQVVTGVSTGSIMATHAFLGDRDLEIRQIYENLQDSMVYSKNSLFKLITANSLYDTTNKRTLLKSHITRDIIDHVARSPERKGLYIGFVNLDSGEFVRVDMVKLAKSIEDKDLRDECYRAVIDASSAIEVAFQPVFIDGMMLGDGGARRHLFMVSPDLLEKKGLTTNISNSTYRIFALVHGDLQIGMTSVKNGILDVAERTANIFTDQTMKDSIRLSHALSTHPEVVVGSAIARTLPKFDPYYAAAAAASCKCKPLTMKECGTESSTKQGADLFCTKYMQCLAKEGELDGRQYATAGTWLPFEKLNLGSKEACSVDTFNRAPQFK